MNNIHWLPEDKWAKAIGQWRLHAGEILSVFNLYGMGDYIPGALGELEEITIDFSKRVRGDKDQPIRVKNRRNARRLRE